MIRRNEGVDVGALADVAERFFRASKLGWNRKSRAVREIARRHLPKGASERLIDSLEDRISKEVFRRMGERAKRKGPILTGRSTNGQPMFIGDKHWLERTEERHEAIHAGFNQ